MDWAIHHACSQQTKVPGKLLTWKKWYYFQRTINRKVITLLEKVFASFSALCKAVIVAILKLPYLMNFCFCRPEYCSSQICHCDSFHQQRFSAQVKVLWETQQIQGELEVMWWDQLERLNIFFFEVREWGKNLAPQTITRTLSWTRFCEQICWFLYLLLE